MEIKTIGIDLAKNVFQVHAVDSRGKVVLRKQFRRDRVATFFALWRLRPRATARCSTSGVTTSSKPFFA